MATTQLVKVTVEELSKFGFKANGRYVNYSKQLKESDKALVVPGAQFEAEFYVSDSGKEYLNKIVSKLETPKSATKKVEVKPEVKKEAKAQDMTRADWDAKDRRISRQGFIQVAVQVTANFDDARELADKMLAYVNEVK